MFIIDPAVGAMEPADVSTVEAQLHLQAITTSFVSSHAKQKTDDSQAKLFFPCSLYEPRPSVDLGVAGIEPVSCKMDHTELTSESERLLSTPAYAMYPKNFCDASAVQDNQLFAWAESFQEDYNKADFEEVMDSLLKMPIPSTIPNFSTTEASQETTILEYAEL